MDWSNLFDKPKDFVIQNLLQYYFGRYIKRMLELSIDRENKKLHAVVDLAGEVEPISVDAQYEIILNEPMDGARVRADSISISREWIDLLAQEFVGQEFRIEGENAARLIKLAKDIGLV